MAIFGFDMSHYDQPSIGNAVSQGIAFVTHKAGGDNQGGDPELGQWWTGVTGLGASVLLGAYWVLRPDLYSNAISEADRFLARLDSQCPGWRSRDAFLLQADCEKWNGDAATQPSLVYIRAFCDRLAVATGGYRPVVYASKGQYGDRLNGLGYPLWNAAYPHAVAESASAAYTRAGGDTGEGWVTYSGQMPTIWQFTSSAVIGGQSTSDANAYRGTLDQLKALVAPAAEGDDVSQADVVAGLTQWFSMASTAALGQAPAGDVGKAYRNYRDYLQNTVGKPTDLTQVLSAISSIGSVSIDYDKLAAALVPPVVAAMGDAGTGADQQAMLAALKQFFGSALTATSTTSGS